MLKMNPTERIFATLNGEEVDRVLTFSILYDQHPAHQVLGYPKLTDADLLNNKYVKFIIKRWGAKRLGKFFVKETVKKDVYLGIEAAVKLGFDSAWAPWAPNLSCFPDLNTIQDDWGNHNDISFDDHGNATYYYREPKIISQKAYEEWPFFPDPDKIAKKAYKFYKEMYSKFGDKICLFGEVYSPIYQAIFLGVGFEKLSYYILKKPDFIKDFITRLEEYATKVAMALMDAGLKVIMKGDDFAFKTGPQFSPKIFDKYWGPAYTRLCEAVHERGGKMIMHSCGDNTKLFDNFIKWGFDGGHAYENTSNVDIYAEKKLHGDKFTIIGGMGVDYLLTFDSKPEEVVEKTKELIKNLAPGGRFILAPAHSHPEVDMSKEKIMLETAWEYGKYPLNF